MTEEIRKRFEPAQQRTANNVTTAVDMLLSQIIPYADLETCTDDQGQACVDGAPIVAGAFGGVLMFAHRFGCPKEDIRRIFDHMFDSVWAQFDAARAMSEPPQGNA